MSPHVIRSKYKSKKHQLSCSRTVLSRLDIIKQCALLGKCFRIPKNSLKLIEFVYDTVTSNGLRINKKSVFQSCI